MEKPYWSELLKDVLAGRIDKPRISGLTMVIDTGIPITMMRDLLQLSAAHIDFWKFGFASASVCPPERTLDKITLCQEYNVLAYPGGTSLEIAYTQGVWKAYLESLWASGVKVVEVSDGTIELPIRVRREIIRTARKIGFTVLSEIGKKVEGSFIPVREQAKLIQGDIQSGANYIIVEGREAGLGVGVYDGNGDVRDDDVCHLLDELGPYSTRLIWEAPLAKQQTYYISKFGNHVNLGNIKPMDIITLESLRRGFRSDTLRVGLGMPLGTSGQSIISHRDEFLAGHKGSQSNGELQDTNESQFPIDKPTLWTQPKWASPRKRAQPFLGPGELLS